MRCHSRFNMSMGDMGGTLLFSLQHQLIIGRWMKISITKRVSCLTNIYIYIYIHNYIYISSMPPTQPQRTSCYWSVELHQSPSCEFTPRELYDPELDEFLVSHRKGMVNDEDTEGRCGVGVSWVKVGWLVGWLDGFTSPRLLVAIVKETLLGPVADTWTY